MPEQTSDASDTSQDVRTILIRAVQDTVDVDEPTAGRLVDQMTQSALNGMRDTTELR